MSRKKKDRIYISGPVTGIGTEAARQNFDRAEQHLRSQGYRTVNPLKMRLPVWLATHCGRRGYRLCLVIELAWLALTCDAIYILRGWIDSPGARAERTLAYSLRLPVIYEQGKQEFMEEMKRRKSTAKDAADAFAALGKVMEAVGKAKK